MKFILKPTIMELPTVGTEIVRNKKLYGVVKADDKTNQPMLYLPTPSSFQQVVFQLVIDEEEFCFFCKKKLTSRNSNVDHLTAQMLGGPSIYKLRPVPYIISDKKDLKLPIDTSDISKESLQEAVTNCHRTCIRCNNLKSTVDEDTFNQALIMLNEGKSVIDVKRFIRKAEKQQYESFIEAKSIEERFMPIVSDIPCALIKDNWFKEPGSKKSKRNRCKRFFLENGFFKELVILDRNLEVISGRLVVRISEAEGIETVKAVVISNVEINPQVFYGIDLTKDT